MKRAVVLGAGMVGSTIAADLACDDEYEVTIADARDAALDEARCRAAPATVRGLQVDLSDPATVRSTVEPFDIVLGALSSAIGFQTLRAVIEAGRDYCDISFMPEDGWSLDELARERGVTAVIDCGVAPGLSNLLAALACARLDECRRLAIYVGGIPVQRSWPFQYKAGFAPSDVIEEYTRPARIVENGQVVEREALSEPEFLEVPGLGTLEAFNTDGLRSLVHTISVPNMVEKTLRYPGHRELMAAFRAAGLFGTEPVEVGGTSVRPLDLTSALLFPQWTYEPGEGDLTVMRVVAEGTLDNKATRLQWDMVDRSEGRDGVTSMSRTTAFPCAIVARMIASGRFREPGVVAPEAIGKNTDLADEVMDELRRRGVDVGTVLRTVPSGETGSHV